MHAFTSLALLSSPLALAGEKAVQEVEINTQYKYASGALGSARNSADNLQSIGCGVYSYPGGITYVSCSARSAKPQSAWCWSTDAKLVSVGLGISTDSSLLFTWNDDGTCSSIQLYNGSNTEPKRP